MTVAREREIRIPYGTIAAREWGEPGAQRVLAVHGWLDNAASFDALAPLIDGVHLVAIDLPGHGRSSHRPVGNWYHFVDYLTDLLSVADALAWERFTLLGHSLGGAACSMLAGALPDRVEALWLVEALGPLSTPPAKSRSLLGQALLDREKLTNKSLRVFRTIEEAVAARVQAGTISEGAARRIVERGLRAVDGGYVWSSDPRLTLTSALRYTEPQILDVIAGIACPTLIVMAEPLAPFLDAELMARRRAVIPDLALVTLQGSHHVHLESPEPVAQAIAAFRARVLPNAVA